MSDDLIIDAYMSGASTVELALLVGCDRGTINRRLRLYGVALRTKNEAATLRASKSAANRSLQIEKVCSKCQVVQSAGEFDTRLRDGHLYLHSWCRTCVRERARNRVRIPRTKEQKAQDWQKQRMRMYGITQEEYDQMCVDQDGKCSICLIEPTSGLCIDHNHVTGEVRALLCRKCNATLGLFNEDTLLIKRAIDYLNSF